MCGGDDAYTLLHFLFPFFKDQRSARTHPYHNFTHTQIPLDTILPHVMSFGQITATTTRHRKPEFVSVLLPYYNVKATWQVIYTLL